MTNEKEVEDEKVEEIELDNLDDTTDWKAKAKEIEQKRREDGIRNRERTKALKEKLASQESKPAEQDKPKKGLDLIEKTYLKASGVESEFHSLAFEIMQETGKSLEDVVDSKYFQLELKERRETKASKDALPTASKRSTSSSRDSVEYWLAKGELPPVDQPELRRQVVSAKIKKSEGGNKFTSRPIV